MNAYANKKFISLILVAAAIVVVAAVLFGGGSPAASGAYISTDVAGLAEAMLPATVELSNGDTYDLVATMVKKNINGTEFRMLAYNGSIPGPLIKVKQGSTVTINFRNNTDMDTALHPHGLRLDNQFDGVPGMTQQAVKPGESFVYKLKFPDAGMYWYHPHVREDYQQELGMYGNFLVTPNSVDYWSPVNREVALFVDDILIEHGVIDLSKDGADHTMMGRYGNVMLVNGEANYTFSAKRGEVIRFYITNSANARPFNIAIQGAKLKLVGSDGGAYEKDRWVDSVKIGPSERAIVEVLFDKSGTFAIQNKTPDVTYSLGTINVLDASPDVSYAKEFSILKTHAATVRSIDPFRVYFDKAPDKQINLTLDMGGNMMNMQGMGHGAHMMPNGQMMGGSMTSVGADGIEWEDTMQMMNQMSSMSSVTWKIVDQATGKANMDIDWAFKLGQPVKIRIVNDPNSMHPMQHEVHFHGQQFLVVTRNGVPQTDLAWKDTVLVPSGQTVDILLNPSNPGVWMAHCHTAEHLEAGMMFGFKVQ